MDKGLRVVGFTFSNHGNLTLNAEVASAKLQTQRSLLSELLAAYAVSNDYESEEDESYEDEEDDDFEHDGEEAVPVARQDTFGQRSSPILIPCPESLANQRAKDAYRRLLYQRQVEQLHYQQQQLLQYQAQQQYLLLQQQRQLQHMQQQQQQVAQNSRQAVQERDTSVQACGPNPRVPVY